MSLNVVATNTYFLSQYVAGTRKDRAQTTLSLCAGTRPSCLKSLNAYQSIGLGNRNKHFLRPLRPSSLPNLLNTVASWSSKFPVTCAYDTPQFQSSYSDEISDIFLKKVSSLWEKSPEPVKVFPWKKAAIRTMHHIFMLMVEVGKWLAVPILFVSSLSEMIYCGLQDKEFVIPIGIVLGVLFAALLKNTAIELSSDLQEGEFPWHLLFIASLLILLKLGGPYYPYWARLFLPQFANGGLWTTLWFARGARKVKNEATVDQNAEEKTVEHEATVDKNAEERTQKNESTVDKSTEGNK
eukprot:TRINITY_DN28407_c0_g1_i1.p1 TRINITY_DN28407_c0_g1~~TRINITY_DN28407_c0_g1_i1.p1  ORF type:complete len:296 (-),score=47.47 TRINITY_DN28407_c0_g1_i1:440-1327(-)